MMNKKCFCVEVEKRLKEREYVCVMELGWHYLWWEGIRHSGGFGGSWMGEEFGWRDSKVVWYSQGP